MISYFRVLDSTHPSMTAVPGPPIWGDIREVLDTHGEWEPWLQQSLGIFFRNLRSIAAKEAENAERKKQQSVS